MNPIRLAAPALLLAWLLAATTGCDRGEPEERSGAVGQILPGSASDAMLQTDRLTSQAPLADPSPGDDAEPGKPRGKGGANRASARRPTRADSAAPTPTATPTPETAAAEGQ